MSTTDVYLSPVNEEIHIKVFWVGYPWRSFRYKNSSQKVYIHNPGYLGLARSPDEHKLTLQKCKTIQKRPPGRNET